MPCGSGARVGHKWVASDNGGVTTEVGRRSASDGNSLSMVRLVFQRTEVSRRSAVTTSTTDSSSVFIWSVADRCSASGRLQVTWEPAEVTS